MKVNTYQIAKEILEKNILNDKTFTIKDLFFIRDCCMGLAKYGLQDQDLLNETLLYIGERVGE